MIVILSGPGDLHADAVERELSVREADHVRIDSALFPDRIGLDLRLDGTGAVGGALLVDRTVADRTRIDLASITAVWVRRPGTPTSRAVGLGERTRRTVSAEAEAVLADLWHVLDAEFLPGTPNAIAAAAHKGGQLLRAARLGFDVPPTSIGNDPDAFLAFVADRPSSYVTKRAAPSQRLTDEAGAEISRLTQPLRPRDLVHAEDWRRCPMIVQASVPKVLELRVTVVGRSVFAASIDSQRANHTRHDWRRFDHRNTPVRPYALPADVAERCRALTAHYGLSYGAIDLVLTPDGRYVFLEINPNGQYLWVEQLSGMPISAALADLLVHGARDHETGPTFPKARAC